MTFTQGTGITSLQDCLDHYQSDESEAKLVALLLLPKFLPAPHHPEAVHIYKTTLLKLLEYPFLDQLFQDEHGKLVVLEVLSTFAQLSSQCLPLMESKVTLLLSAISQSNLDLTLKILTLTSIILCCSSTATTEKFWKNTAEKEIIPHLTVTATTTETAYDDMMIKFLQNSLPSIVNLTLPQNYLSLLRIWRLLIKQGHEINAQPTSEQKMIRIIQLLKILQDFLKFTPNDFWAGDDEVSFGQIRVILLDLLKDKNASEVRSLALGLISGMLRQIKNEWLFGWEKKKEQKECKQKLAYLVIQLALTETRVCLSRLGEKCPHLEQGHDSFICNLSRIQQDDAVASLDILQHSIAFIAEEGEKQDAQGSEGVGIFTWEQLLKIGSLFLEGAGDVIEFLGECTIKGLAAGAVVSVESEERVESWGDLTSIPILVPAALRYFCVWMAEEDISALKCSEDSFIRLGSLFAWFCHQSFLACNKYLSNGRRSKRSKLWKLTFVPVMIPAIEQLCVNAKASKVEEFLKTFEQGHGAESLTKYAKLWYKHSRSIPSEEMMSLEENHVLQTLRLLESAFQLSIEDETDEMMIWYRKQIL